MTGPERPTPSPGPERPTPSPGPERPSPPPGPEHPAASPTPHPSTRDPSTRDPNTRDPNTRDPNTRDPNTRDPNTVAVILGEDAPVLEVAIPLRVFGADLSGRGVTPYRVLAVTEHDRPVTTTAGLRLDAPHRLAEVDGAGIVVVPGWRRPGGRPPAPAVLAAIRRAHDDGALLLGLCVGAFVLADAGVLRDRPATTHWLHTAELARYPGVRVRPDVLYVDDGQVVTSAGSAAGLDACLHVLRRQRGAEAAATVARTLVVAPHRAGGQSQFVERPVPPTADDGTGLGAVIENAMAHLDDPDLDVDALAGLAHMSRRTFDRRFRAVVGDSPLQWLLRQRVLRAQRLLEATGLSVDEVARSVGFADGVSLRPHFRRVVGVPPQVYRDSFRSS